MSGAGAGQNLGDAKKVCLVFRTKNQPCQQCMVMKTMLKIFEI